MAKSRGAGSAAAASTRLAGGKPLSSLFTRFKRYEIVLVIPFIV
jgi:hypothetical protein